MELIIFALGISVACCSLIAAFEFGRKMEDRKIQAAFYRAALDAKQHDSMVEHVKHLSERFKFEMGRKDTKEEMRH